MSDPWKRSAGAATGGYGQQQSQPMSLNEIMSSQYIQEIEHQSFKDSGVLQDNDPASTPSSDLTEEEKLAIFYAEAGLDSNGQPFPEAGTDTDADLAMALELQEHENQQNDAELKRRAYQQSLDNQKGHVKIIDGDYYHESEILAAQGGGYRADLASLEEENIHHSKEVFKVQAQVQHKQTKKGISTGSRVDRKTYATSEGVLDSRTRLMLFKLIQNGTLERIHGVVKTGKEASVYCAEKGAAFDQAIPATNRAHKGERGVGVNNGWNRDRGVRGQGQREQQQPNDSDHMEREFVVLEDDDEDLEEEGDVGEVGSSSGSLSGSVLDAETATAIKMSLSELPVLDIHARRFVPRGTETPCSSSGPALELDAALEAARHQQKQQQQQQTRSYSTGKSGGVTSSNTVVIKIFRTTLNEFSNRRNYIYGDYRYFFTAKEKSLRVSEEANDRSVIMATTTTTDDKLGTKDSDDTIAAATNNTTKSIGTLPSAELISSVPVSELGLDYRHIHKKDVINMWCEKEYRNLNRSFMAGVRVPCPYLFRQHVLIMSCVPYTNDNDDDNMGADGTTSDLPALQLREYFKATPNPNTADVTTTVKELKLLKRLLAEIVAAMHMLYHDARLVHADLSEYNILCSSGHAVLIDFGQAVDITHPRSQEFLEHDVTTIVNWFEKMMSARVRLLQSQGHDQDYCGALLLSIGEIVDLVMNPFQLNVALQYVTVHQDQSDGDGDGDMSEEESEYEWIQPPREEEEEGNARETQSGADAQTVSAVGSARDAKREKRRREQQQVLEHAVQARQELETILVGLLFRT